MAGGSGMGRRRTTGAAVLAGGAVLAAGAVGLAGGTRPAAATTTRMAVAAATPGSGASTVAVDGVGEAIGVPDTLLLSLGVDVTRSDVSAALAAAGTAATAVMDALAKDGVAKADMQTTDLSVSPRADRRGRTVGYRVTESLAVTLHDFARAGGDLGDAVAAGGDAVRVQGLTPALHDMAAPGSTARARAFSDAQAKAQQYAALAGRTLGSVVTIDASTSTPQDTASTARAAAGTASAAAPSVPVAAGSVPVEVTVSVVFSLR